MHFMSSLVRSKPARTGSPNYCHQASKPEKTHTDGRSKLLYLKDQLAQSQLNFQARISLKKLSPTHRLDHLASSPKISCRFPCIEKGNIQHIRLCLHAEYQKDRRACRPVMLKQALLVKGLGASARIRQAPQPQVAIFRRVEQALINSLDGTGDVCKRNLTSHTQNSDCVDNTSFSSSWSITSISNSLIQTDSSENSVGTLVHEETLRNPNHICCSLPGVQSTQFE